jgi:hypothetical protein
VRPEACARLVALGVPAGLADTFPLTPHPTGRWCKKIRGKIHFFGKLADGSRPSSATRMRRMICSPGVCLPPGTKTGCAWKMSDVLAINARQIRTDALNGKLSIEQLLDT